MSRISYFTDMEKSVVTANFLKRGWTSATSDEDWNFYWYGSDSFHHIRLKRAFHVIIIQTALLHLDSHALSSYVKN